MNNTITISSLTYRARAIAKIKGKNEYDLIDIITAAVSLDDEWTDENSFIEHITGIGKIRPAEITSLIEKVKFFDEPEGTLKNEITIKDKNIQEDLNVVRKELQDKFTEEDICKRVVIKAVEIAQSTELDFLKSLGFESSLLARYKFLERVVPVKKFQEEKKILFETLKQKVVGQDTAVEKLVKTFAAQIKKIEVNESPTVPSCVFLIGDIGSGKTTLAKELVSNIPASWGKWQSKYLNATQFDSLRIPEIEKLLFDDNGLFSVVRTNPSVIFIIDEIYEASSGFFDIMQQVLGEGSYQLPISRINFSHAFFILITNQGERLYNKQLSGIFADSISFPREVFMESLLDDRTRHFFNDSEKKKAISSLLDRVDDFIVLNKLSFSARKRIIKNLLTHRLNSWKELYRISVIDFSDEFVELLAYSSLHIISCRQIEKYIFQTVFNEVETRIVDLFVTEKLIDRINLTLEQNGYLESYLENANVGKGNRFLCIDDTVKYHDIIRKQGFDQVICAKSVAQAKTVINETRLKKIDWILLDLVFPNGEPDGLEFLRDFREKHKIFPVYLFSTKINTLKEFFDITRAGGAAGFVEKSALITSNKESIQKTNALEVLKERLYEISKETGSERTARQLQKEGQSLNIVISSRYIDKTNTLYFEITNLKREPKLTIHDSDFNIVYPDVTFNDIKGQSNTVEEIKRWLDKVKNNRYNKSDKGILLYGPPGTGKTMIAKAIANEIEALFIAITPAILQSKYLGESEEAVRKLFADARKNQPAVIFIDEIESIGNRAKFSGEYSWQSTFVNSFLAEMDGFDENEDVFVIGATNHIDQIDAALLRPGRIGRHILVPLPQTIEDRREIILYYLNKALLKHNISDNDLQRIARITKGISPADIMLMVGLAQDIAGLEGKEIIDSVSLGQARTELLLGKVSKESHNPETLKTVACHEAGHALVSRKLGMEVFQVTVLMRESDQGFLGFSESVIGNPIKDRDMIINNIAVCLAGREAEKIILGKYFDGASSDLIRAQKYAESILTLGLTDSGLPEIITPTNHEYSDVNEYDSESKRKIVDILKEGQERCIRLLVENRKELDDMIGRLVNEKTIFFND